MCNETRLIEAWMTLALLCGLPARGRAEDAAVPPPTIADKTLVAWASPATLDQQGAGVVSMMQGTEFDAIVLGEILRGRWMPGSDYFRRTERTQAGWPAETAGPGQYVQIAIVYSGNHITVYRNGQLYTDYEAAGQQAFRRGGDVLIGARYRAEAGTETGFFNGDIEEVRVYDRTLDAGQIKALTPGNPGDTRPLGMWTFDGGSLKDRMNNYPQGYLQYGATIVDGKLRLNGRGQYLLVSDEPPSETELVQSGFFTPIRRGQMWDTWAYHHDGQYYLYYLGGEGGHWDGHELAVSDDGVNWKEHGVILKPRAGTIWMGTGHIWKSPHFGENGLWISNYSEHYETKQDIMFATSTDLLNWHKVDEEYRFVQDTRWYKEHGRWDCIDVLEYEQGVLYGYFTATPDAEKVKYPHCGFGMAESKDGIKWTALPPPGGNISGEFGGIHKIGDLYYILISEGRVASSDDPKGPFLSQKKNPNAFGECCDIYFPRFFHNAPGGPLVNHFCRNGPVFAAPFKAVEVDEEGILRLKWWKGNDKLKVRRVDATLLGDGGSAVSIRMCDQEFPQDKVHVIEGVFSLTNIELTSEDPDRVIRRGIFFDHGNGSGDFLAVDRDSVSFGEMRADGGRARIRDTICREIDFGSIPRFRLVIKYNMAELYVNDYLMIIKRVRSNGHLGIIGDAGSCPASMDVWQSE